MVVRCNEPLEASERETHVPGVRMSKNQTHSILSSVVDVALRRGKLLNYHGVMRYRNWIHVDGHQQVRLRPISGGISSSLDCEIERKIDTEIKEVGPRQAAPESRRRKNSMLALLRIESASSAKKYQIDAIRVAR